MSPLIRQTIMSQYANSPVLMRLVDDLTEAIDPAADIELFYNMVFNLYTAQGFGLDIWGRIVNIGRQMSFPDPEGEFFGFEDGFYPFNQRPFSSGAQGSAYDLPDNTYRELILIQALSNIIKATAPNINRLLKAVFDRKAYFLIVGPMKARYVFEFDLTPFDRHIIYNTSILPRPCGVEIDAFDAVPPTTFGFYGTDFQPFNQGTFYGRTA